MKFVGICTGGFLDIRYFLPNTSRNIFDQDVEIFSEKSLSMICVCVGLWVSGLWEPQDPRDDLVSGEQAV